MIILIFINELTRMFEHITGFYEAVLNIFIHRWVFSYMKQLPWSDACQSFFA